MINFHHFKNYNVWLIQTDLKLVHSKICSWRFLLNTGKIFSSKNTHFMVQDTSKKSPMQLINEVPPIKVEGRIVACEGGISQELLLPILKKVLLLSQ